MASLDDMERIVSQRPDLKQLVLQTGQSFLQFQSWSGAQPSVSELQVALNDFNLHAQSFCQGVDYSLSVAQEGYDMAGDAEYLCQTLADPETSDKEFVIYLEDTIESAQKAQTSALEMQSRFREVHQGLIKTSNDMQKTIAALEVRKTEADKTQTAVNKAAALAIRSGLIACATAVSLPLLLGSVAHDVRDAVAEECTLESAKLADAGKVAAKLVLDVDTLAKSATHFASWWGTVITILNGLRKSQKCLGDSTTTDQRRARAKQCERSWKQIKQEYHDYRNQIAHFQDYYPSARLSPENTRRRLSSSSVRRLEAEFVSDPEMTYEEEAAEAAHVICRPHVSDTTNRKLAATSIKDCSLLDTQWNSGGCIVSVYDPTLADAWIDTHFDHACLVKLRKQGCWGPVAMMLSIESEALAIFGEMSAKLIHQADELANISGFPVIIRPLVDIPSITFKDCKTCVSMLSTGNQESSSGAPPSGTDQNAGASQNFQSRKKHYQCRGIGSHSTDEHEDNESEDDDDKPVPPPQGGMNTNQEITHKSEIQLGIVVDDQDKRDCLKVLINAKFYPEPNSNWDTLVSVDEPVVRAHISLVTRSTTSFEVDSAIGSVGFLAHGQKYLWTEHIIPLTAYAEPDFKMKFISGRTWSGKLGGKLGLVATMDFSAEQGGSSATEAAPEGVAPRWIVSWEHNNDNWDNNNSSFRTSNVRFCRWPKGEHRFHKRDIKAEYEMAVEINQVQNLPPLSFIYVHQIQSWMAAGSKAKVRGINVVIAHYLPNVRTRIPLRILVSPKLKLLNKNVLGQEGAESLNEQQKCDAPFAVATAVAPAQRPKGALSRVIDYIFPRQRDVETMATYRHIDRGWDHSNMQWGHTAWPEWCIESDSPQEASSTRWKVDWKFGTMPSSLTDGDPGIAGTSSTSIGDGLEYPRGTRDKGKGKEVMSFSSEGLD